MDRNLPSRAQSLLCRQTRIVQPSLIEEVCGAVWTSGPCQRRDGVDYKANALYISRFFEAMSQGCHARIIQPYGLKTLARTPGGRSREGNCTPQPFLTGRLCWASSGSNSRSAGRTDVAHGMQMEKAAQWRERFHRFHRAGTSITRFCRREGISATSFYLWRRKLRPEPAAGVGRSHQEDAPAQPRQGSFVPVRMLGGLNFGGQMTMTAELPGGTRLLIPVADRCAKYTKAGHPSRLRAGGRSRQAGAGCVRQDADRG